VDFTGLDGDADRAYVLQGWITTSQYGPGAPYLTFTTDLADPVTPEGATVLTMGGASSLGISNLDSAGINFLGPSFPGAGGFSGGFQTTILAESGDAPRTVLSRSSISSPGDSMVSGRIPGAGKLTAIHVKAAVSWSAGTRFRLYAYTP
jgi:hypothetical protein